MKFLDTNDLMNELMYWKEVAFKEAGKIIEFEDVRVKNDLSFYGFVVIFAGRKIGMNDIDYLRFYVWGMVDAHRISMGGSK